MADGRAALERGPWADGQSYWCQALATAYERRSWFPLPAEGEAVEGAFLVSMHGAVAGAEFTGTSTLLVTTTRVAGICATGSSMRGPLDPAVGPVVVWSLPRGYGGRSRLVFDGAGGGPRLTITPPESTIPVVEIDQVQRVAGPAYAASAPGELARVLGGTARPAPGTWLPRPTGSPPTRLRSWGSPRSPAPSARGSSLAVLTLLLALVLAGGVALAPVVNFKAPIDLTPAWDASALRSVILAWQAYLDESRLGVGNVNMVLTVLSATTAITLVAAMVTYAVRSQAAASVTALFAFLTAGTAVAYPMVLDGLNGDTLNVIGAGAWAAFALGLLVCATATGVVRTFPNRDYRVAVFLFVAVAAGTAIAVATTRPETSVFRY